MMILRFVHLYWRSVLLFTMAAVLTACPPRLAPNVTLERGLVYGVGHVYDGAQDAYVLQDLLFDLMQPTDSPLEQRPALILIHGGGFTEGSKEDEDLFVLGNNLASAGYVCFLIDYRLMGSQPPAPPPYDATDLQTAAHAATVDAKTAIRHVRANAAEYAVAPNRIAVIGESAGAIAGMAASVSDQGEYAADGEAFPIPGQNNPGVDEIVMATVDLWGSADEFLDEFDSADPPIMVVHGGQDFTVGISLLPALNIISECKDHGIPYRYYPDPEAGHGVWELEVDGKNLSQLIFDFLQEFMPE